jgi:hypothetical protein
MIRTFGRLGLIAATTFVFLLGSVAVVAAHDVAATLTCAEAGVTLHIAGSGYPDGSTVTYSIDGGAPATVSANGTYDIDAGSPTVAHTADVLWNSSDGLTQFNYHFALTSDACVEAPSVPSTEPSGGEGPISSGPSPSQEVKGITGTPRPTPPPTDVASDLVAPSNDGWQLLVGVLAVATVALYLVSARRSSRAR